MAPGRSSVRMPPAGLGQGALNWLGKVRLDKVLFKVLKQVLP